MGSNEYKEYGLEGGKEVSLDKLKSVLLDKRSYQIAHQGLVIPCHDVFINYNGGLLLVERKNFPAKNELWPIGGRLQRGMLLEESLRKKAHEECNLFLEDLKFLGVGRTFFSTDPFNHDKGTDTLNLVFSAKGKGTIKLDDLHSRPTLVEPKDYMSLRSKLHPYVQEYIDLLLIS